MKPKERVVQVLPKSFRLLMNPNRRCVEHFVEAKAKSLIKGSSVLDAGAGPCPYKKFFEHCNYSSTDFVDPNNVLDFVCSLDSIPKDDETYDAVLSTEVLEHVSSPQKVMKEFYRVLKKKGKLFLTVPQCWMIHQEPYNFFYFTKYGLILILEEAGFKDYDITPKGGWFWFLSDAIRFNGILEQYKSKRIYSLLRLLEFPITNILLPLLLFPLDFLDKEKRWTMGYTVEASK